MKRVLIGSVSLAFAASLAGCGGNNNNNNNDGGNAGGGTTVTPAGDAFIVVVRAVIDAATPDTVPTQSTDTVTVSADDVAGAETVVVPGT